MVGLPFYIPLYSGTRTISFSFILHVFVYLLQHRNCKGYLLTGPVVIMALSAMADCDHDS